MSTKTYNPTLWTVRFAIEFEREFAAKSAPVQDELLVQTMVLQKFGPQASRPRVDTLNGSSHANMKELRFDADGGVWRVAFAFDPLRKALLLVASDNGSRDETNTE